MMMVMVMVGRRYLDDKDEDKEEIDELVGGEMLVWTKQYDKRHQPRIDR